MLANLQASAGSPSIWRLVLPNAKPIVVMNEGLLERHIYCVHSVTGDVGGLDTFARCFGETRLHGVQVPRHQMTAHLASTIEGLASHHVNLIESFQPTGPVHLIGWSAGAVVALEMAQQFQIRGREVPLLVALDGAPCNTGAGLSKRDPRYALKVMANIPQWIRDDRTSDWSFGGIRGRISEKIAVRRGGGRKRLKNLGTLDAGAVEEVIARKGWSLTQKAFVHSMYEAMARYIPQPYSGSVLVFETKTQPLFHLRQVGAAWQAICDTPEIIPIEGNHSSLIFPATAATLASRVKKRLATL